MQRLETKGTVDKCSEYQNGDTYVSLLSTHSMKVDLIADIYMTTKKRTLFSPTFIKRLRRRNIHQNNDITKQNAKNLPHSLKEVICKGLNKL